MQTITLEDILFPEKGPKTKVTLTGKRLGDITVAELVELVNREKGDPEDDVNVISQPTTVLAGAGQPYPTMGMGIRELDTEDTEEE